MSNSSNESTERQSKKRTHDEVEEKDDKDSDSVNIDSSQRKKLMTKGISFKSKSMGLSMKLAAPSAKKEVPKTVQRIGKAASAFNGDESDEEEEMPLEAKMRMKNIGRDTPTSSGPNSFGKTKIGFCDTKKIYEKQLRQLEDSLGGR